MALFYLLYYLRDHIGMADPDTGVLLLTVIYAGCTVLILWAGFFLTGWVSARFSW